MTESAESPTKTRRVAKLQYFVLELVLVPRVAEVYFHLWLVFFRHKNPLCLNCYFWRLTISNTSIYRQKLNLALHLARHVPGLFRC